jgi:hypothetical protein
LGFLYHPFIGNCWLNFSRARPRRELCRALPPEKELPAARAHNRAECAALEVASGLNTS